VEGQGRQPRLVTNYGTNWSRLPVTLRLGFVRPRIPAAREISAPAPTVEPAADMIVTSILWTQDGQAMAVYESGPADRRKSGVVKPGDVVDDWQVVEIWRDRVVVADRSSGRQRTVYMAAKKAGATNPQATPSGGAGGTGTRGGRRPAAPVVRP
jgi:hypothetical protein